MYDPWKILYCARILLTEAHEDADRTKSVTVALLLDHIEDLIDDAMLIIGGPQPDEAVDKPGKEAA